MCTFFCIFSAKNKTKNHDRDPDLGFNLYSFPDPIFYHDPDNNLYRDLDLFPSQAIGAFHFYINLYPSVIFNLD